MLCVLRVLAAARPSRALAVPAAVYRWSLSWNPVSDVTVRPVLDDAEARAVISDALPGRNEGMLPRRQV